MYQQEHSLELSVRDVPIETNATGYTHCVLNMKAIELTQGNFALVDDDVFDWLRHWNWSVTRVDKKRSYARRLMHHPTTQKQEFIYLHKIISGVSGDYSVVFRDGNPLNLQRDNMQMLNGRRQEIVWDGSRCESLFKGVTWDKYYGLWRAHLQTLTIGYYICEFDAVEAYNQKAHEILKDRADINSLESVCRLK